MYPPRRRFILLVIIIISVLGGLLPFLSGSADTPIPDAVDRILSSRRNFFGSRFQWRDLRQRYPVKSLAALPSGKAVSIPRIQHEFPRTEDRDHAAERKLRLEAVKNAFVHSWNGYRKHAWLHDEVHPLSGDASDPFGGWGATLVDSLDTLWIMGMKKEFDEAVVAISRIDFRVAKATKLSVFETNIRYLGGLLGAYDVSGHRYSVLLRKAVELGDMLYMAFDTPNRMPVVRWDWKAALLGNEQIASSQCSIAEIGSLSMEFTRLSQLTKDRKWYDAVARITGAFEVAQGKTRIPGLWPTYVNALSGDFTKDTAFTLGAMADSMYEYLPKQYLLLDGQAGEYRKMYLRALSAMKDRLFFQPVIPEPRKMLITGPVSATRKHNKKTTMEHLSCFTAGMVALAAKAFEQPSDLETARELLDGCIWASEGMASGIMPEVFTAQSCEMKRRGECVWNERDWLHAVYNHNYGRKQLTDAADVDGYQMVQDDQLPPGLLRVDDSRYNLRPEVIESVFVLYRATGDHRFYETAWKMFQSVESSSKTAIAYASLEDVRDRNSRRIDNMESFWTAETLKYFYLIFSDPNYISLDEYVL